MLKFMPGKRKLYVESTGSCYYNNLNVFKMGHKNALKNSGLTVAQLILHILLHVLSQVTLYKHSEKQLSLFCWR